MAENQIYISRMLNDLSQTMHELVQTLGSSVNSVKVRASNEHETYLVRTDNIYIPATASYIPLIKVKTFCDGSVSLRMLAEKEAGTWNLFYKQTSSYPILGYVKEAYSDQWATLDIPVANGDTLEIVATAIVPGTIKRIEFGYAFTNLVIDGPFVNLERNTNP